MKTDYRIQKKDGKIKFAGTGINSWFSLEQARKLVNYKEGEMVVEHDGVHVLWEVC